MRKCLIMLFLAAPLAASAQSDDFGIWYSVGADKKIDSKWSVGAEAEFRTRNDAKTADRWSVGVDGEFKMTKWLKMGAGYTFLRDNNAEKMSFNSNGTYNNWRPSYWGNRHRVNVDVTVDKKLGRFKVALRERWQYTYRPEVTTTRYDFDNSKWEEKTRNSKGKNALRSRFQVGYDIAGSKVDPYANVEAYNAWSVYKMRYTVGAEWKIKKAHVVDVAYRYQKLNSDSEVDTEPDSHILSVGYKWKF